MFNEEQKNQNPLSEEIKSKSLTPVMAQYFEIKKEYPDCLLLMRMGDFYELFFDDSKIASKVLGITLTKRGVYNNEPIPMCGVPYHSFDIYAKKLIKENFKLAICEQLESVEEAKKRGNKAVLKRGVVRIITAGTIFEEEFLENSTNNFLMALFMKPNTKIIGIAIADISTGAFYTIDEKIENLQSVITRYNPSEILVPNYLKEKEDLYNIFTNYNTVWLPEAKFTLYAEKKRVLSEFDVKTLSAFGNFKNEEIIAAGVIIAYIKLTQKNDINFAIPKKINDDNFLYIDSQTIKNLEIIKGNNIDKKCSLIDTIKNTKTAFGGRQFNMRMLFPLKDIQSINSRLDGVKFFIDNENVQKTVLNELSEIPDFERALSRIKFKRAVPSDFGILRYSLYKTKNIVNLLNNFVVNNNNEIHAAISLVKDFSSIINTLETVFSDNDLPNNLRTNGFIKKGFNKELDEYREIFLTSEEMIKSLEVHYIRETGVNNLKIKHNNIIGFFVEVTNSQKDKLGDDFIKKQDTVNTARYKTIEISELEQKIIIAKEKYQDFEFSIFYEMVDYITKNYDIIHDLIKFLSVVDIASSNAEFAIVNNLTSPILDESCDIEIKSGRHIVIEKNGQIDQFIPNDTYITKSKLSVITGPNMSGKSTYLRQNALIVIMAHVGMYVPALYARIGVVDKVFSRIGASDDIASGKSTFMVEMIETAIILNQATEKSFVILDEVGRGTSTYDGFSIAAGVLEHLYNVNKSRAFFATHYHEIQYLSVSMPLMQFLTLKISEHGDDVIFHHKIINGITDKSYGLYVAKIAGIPKRALKYSANLLKKLHSKDLIKDINTQRLDLKF